MLNDLDVGDLTVALESKWRTPDTVWLHVFTQDQKSSVSTDMSIQEAKALADFIYAHIKEIES
jgi:hypothetical protein